MRDQFKAEILTFFLQVRKTRKPTDPAKTATMAGGLFAIQGYILNLLQQL